MDFVTRIYTLYSLSVGHLLPHEVFNQLEKTEEELGKYKSIDDDFLAVPELHRMIIDLMALIRLKSSEVTAQLEEEIIKVEPLARANADKRASKDTIRAIILRDSEFCRKLTGDINGLENLYEHLKDLRQLSLIRKEILLERSAERRSVRRDERESI